MLGTPITRGFDYDQQSIPTGAIATGATWRRRNSSSVAVLDYVWDGNFWRITGGLKNRRVSLWPAVATATAVTGSATTPVFQTLGRRISIGSGAVGTARITFNSGSGGNIAPLGGGASSGTDAVFDFANPIEILLRTRLRRIAEGVFRWYLTGTNPSPTADLATKGFGFSWDLAASNLNIHIHDGTSLSTQSVSLGSALGAATTDYIVNFELCWTGSALGLYVNEVYLGALSQAVSGSETLLLHLTYDRSSAIAQTQFIDQYLIQTVGGF